MNNKEIEQYVKRIGQNSSVTVQQYTDGIKQLFHEWKAAVDTKGTPFITDGVMDPEKWFAQAERPLFLMKEAYGGEEDWDLVSFVMQASTKEPLPPIWRRISLWAYGMLTEEYKLSGEYRPDAKEFTERGNQYLHGIAAINIKKYCGKKASDYAEIKDYAGKDAKYLCKQISLCDPTVIVCGYTAGALEEKLFGFGKANNPNPEYYYHFELNGHEVLVIDYYHPANHFPVIMNYYTLMSIYDHAKKDQYLRICDEIQQEK